MKEPTGMNFKSRCSSISFDTYANIPNPVDQFTQDVITIMEKTIPKTSSNHHQKCLKPWFNDTCKTTVSARKNALQAFKRHPDIKHLIEYKRLRAAAKRAVKKEKRASWLKFIRTANNRTSLKQAWSVVRKIEGKRADSSISHLSVNGQFVTSREDIVNELACALHAKSSSINYDPQFQQIKHAVENHVINFDSDNAEAYNELLTMSELKNAIACSGNTSQGPDGIHYSVIKKFPPCTLNVLLQLYNKIWQDGSFPGL